MVGAIPITVESVQDTNYFWVRIADLAGNVFLLVPVHPDKYGRMKDIQYGFLPVLRIF